MLNQTKYQKASITLLLLAAEFITSQSLAQSVKNKPFLNQMHPMTEKHNRLADMHKQMANCLESDKAPAACRQEISDSCSSISEDDCAMMDMDMERNSGPGMGMMHESYMDGMTSPNYDTSPASSQIPINNRP